MDLPRNPESSRQVHGGVRARVPAREQAEPDQKHSLDRIAELAQLVKGLKLEPSEAELREIAKELQGMKSKVQSMAHPLIRSENPATNGR
jgi:hypothetical protein